MLRRFAVACHSCCKNKSDGEDDMTRNQKLALKSMAAAVAFASLGAAAQAQQSIDVTLLSGFPPPATVVGAVLDTYVPTVDATLAKTGNFKINWNLAHSGQIVKPRGELEGLESGLGDIALVVTAFHADKVPLYEVSYKTPFTTKDMDLVARTTKQMEDTIPEYQAGWKKFNQFSLYPTGSVENYVVISSKPIKSLSDLKGRKVGAAGPNLPWVRAVGAAGVQTNLADAYNSLSTGIYDNMVVWKQAMGAFKLCEPAPFMIDPGLGAIQSNILNVNLDFFDALPDEVRNAFVGAAEAWHVDNVDRVVNGAAGGLARCEKEFGTKTSVMSDAERKEWAMMMPNIAKEWAAAQDKKGLPGTKILTTYMDAMRATNQPMLRQWDKE
jgi:TRAP-type C4-dicarboxylate transport system substrate-binding protein